MKKLLVFVGAAILMLSFSCKSGEKEDTIPTKKGFVEVDEGIKIFYKAVGTGPETVIIPAGMYLDIEFERLANKDRTLVFYDMRGRGRSSQVTDPERLGMDLETLDLEALCQHLRVERVSLIGWSYLGAMVTLYALEHPNNVKRIIQVAPLPPAQEIFAKATSTRWTAKVKLW